MSLGERQRQDRSVDVGITDLLDGCSLPAEGCTFAGRTLELPEPIVLRVPLAARSRQWQPLKVDPLAEETFLALVEQRAATREQLNVITANVHWLALLRDRPELRSLSSRFEITLIDGVPLRWLAEATTGQDVERLTGADLVPRLCAQSAATGLRLFFLGGAPGVAAVAAGRAASRFDGCRVVGACAPTPAVLADSRASQQLCEEIDARRPDVLFVGFGMPKQEQWLIDHRDDLEVPVRLCVGGSFDMLAGDVRRAPRPVQRVGMEWAWRFAMEPQRLWHRYIVEDLPIGLGIARSVASGRLKRRVAIERTVNSGLLSTEGGEPEVQP